MSHFADMTKPGPAPGPTSEVQGRQGSRAPRDPESRSSIISSEISEMKGDSTRGEYWDNRGQFETMKKTLNNELHSSQKIRATTGTWSKE